MEYQNLINLIITVLRWLFRLLSSLIVRLMPRNFSRIAEDELRALDDALTAFMLVEREPNWMRRSRPGLQSGLRAVRSHRVR